MLEVFNCEQNSPEWHECRRGLPTASEFSTILAKGKSGGKSITRQKYLARLAGEIITGEPEETFTSAAMERGYSMEDEARRAYEFDREVSAGIVGFVRNGKKGASPDSFIGEDGLLEIKTKKPSVFIECLSRDDIPPEHKAQIHGQLWVCEREWCDLSIYWPKMPSLIYRVHRDEDYIKTIKEEVDRFNDELAELVRRITLYGQH